MNIGAIMQNIEISVQRGKTEKIAVNSPAAAPAKIVPKEQETKERTPEIKPPEISTPEFFDLKAVFAQEGKNVVIRFLDEKGQIVRQFPPEEYLNMLNKFQKTVESLFLSKA